MCRGDIAKKLGAFAGLSKNSPYILNNGVELLFQAFTATKPMFKSVEEKTKAYQMFNSSLDNFNSSLSKFNGSLNLDKRQTAQRVRSGLQFLIDELLDFEMEVPESERKMISMVNWDSVRNIEDYIKNTVGLDPEHTTPDPIDLTVIPQSHIWWFYTDEDDDDEN